jgi:hypothetical protein
MLEVLHLNVSKLDRGVAHVMRGKREGARAVPRALSGDVSNVLGRRGPVAGALARNSDATRGARSLVVRTPSDASAPDRMSVC